MASKVISCGYDPDGGIGFKRINPLAPLQTDGDLDISYLVQEIVTKDFGYSGTSKYTLRLHNNKMVLELWNNASGTDKQKYAKIKLENDQWKRGATVLNDSRQTSNRLHHTLDKIRRASNQGQPVGRDGGSAELEATERASRGPVVNNYISCGHPACNHSIDGLQGQLQQQLNALGQRLSELERSIERHQQPRPAQCREHVGKLETTVDSLHEKIAKLQESIDRLQRENADMKGLRDPLETISRDVPEELREIRYQLEQLRTLLGERLSVNSSGAQSQMIREMQDGLSRMLAQLAPLAQSVAILTKAYFELQTENEALKQQTAAQAEKLSLKDREVEELNAKNRAQEETLSKLQAELKQEKAKHNQLHKDLEKEKGKTKRSGIAFNKVSEELEQAQKESAQALAEKAQQVEELKQQLADSKAQNATIEQLRQQLEQANAKSEHAEQENAAQQAELDAARKTNSEAQQQLEALRTELAQSQEYQKRSVIELKEIHQKAEELAAALAAANQTSLDEKNRLEKELSESKLELKKVTAQLEADRKNHAALLEEARKTDAKLQEQISSLHAQLAQSQKAQQISEQKLVEAKGKVEQLEGELTASRKQAVELEKKNTAERQRLDQELTKLRSQLELAEKTDGTSQAKIAELSESLQQKAKELEEQKRAAASAQEAAKQAEQSLQKQKSLAESEKARMQTELNRVEQAYDSVCENWEQSEKALAELKRTALEKEKELNKQIDLLDKHYYELTRERTEELELHYGLDSEQQKIIAELEAELSHLRLQNKDLEKIEQLKQKIQEAQLQQKESAEAKESSNRLYEAQKKELERRNKELEAELLRLKEKLTLNERMLKQQTASVPTEDLRGKLPLPKTHSTSSSRIPRLPVNDSNEMNQIDQTLQNIEQAMKTLDEAETVPPLWVGPIVINMAFLDGELAEDRPSWISGKFEDALDAEELKRVEKSLTGHYEPLTARAYKEKNVNTIAGDLSRVMRHEAIRALQKPDHFKTLESCFSERLFIVKCLKEAKMQLEPIIVQYQTLGDTDPKRQAKFERASKLVEQIDQVLEGIGQKLNQHKWKIQK
jgi:chromosome segregation ATPase